MRTYKVIDSIEDRMRGVVTVEGIPSDGSRGSRVCFEESAVRALGLAGCLKRVGWAMPNERLPVMQRGQQIGTVPGSFEPMDIRSTSFFYEPRAGDFKLTDEGWVAADNLCPGDLEAIPGFVWGRDSDTLPAGEDREDGLRAKQG